MKKIMITTMNHKLYEQYGTRLIESHKETQQLLPLHVFIEDYENVGKFTKQELIHYHNLFELEPECKAFAERNQSKPATNFFEQAIRFSYKVFAQSAARKFGDKVYYIDSDCVFHIQFPPEWYDKCLPDDKFISFYDRPSQYTETGFVAFNNTQPIADEFFKEYKDWYITDKVYEIKRLGKNFWTDCHTLDGTRQKFKNNPKYSEKSLGDGRNGHIMARDSFMNPFIDHRKGPRKHKVQSPEWVLWNKKDDI
jgi:hypothetical protein